MARPHAIVSDCAPPAATARFRAAALDDYAVAPHDDAEPARLRALGITSTEDDPTVLVEGPAGAPRLWFPLVPEGRTVQNRVRPDPRAADPDVEIDRLTGPGATVRARHADNVVLADPEADEFCPMLPAA